MAFDIENFLPYLLNRAAEQSSDAFQAIYKTRYGMLRHEWRVLFHLGYYDSATASQICAIGGLHKTKVSRALRALEEKRFVIRIIHDDDRRFASISLTKKGRAVYDVLVQEAAAFDAQIMAAFTETEKQILIDCLRRLRGANRLGASL